MSLLTNVQDEKLQTVPFIPDALKKCLVQFSVEYLSVEPSNIIDFGIEYFMNLRNHLDSTLTSFKSAVLSEQVIEPLSSIQISTEDDKIEICSNYIKTEAQTLYLLEILRKLIYFQDFDDDEINKIVCQMYNKSVSENEMMICENSADKSLYVIDDGIFVVKINDEIIDTYENCGYFTMLELNNKYQPDVKIQAKSNGNIWILDWSIFQRCWLKDDHKKCRTYELILESIPILHTLSEDERIFLADEMITKRFQMDDYICNEGGTSKLFGIYFIEKGRVLLCSTSDAQSIILKTGQYFGQLTSKKESLIKSAQAIGYVQCAILSLESFNRLAGKSIQTIKTNLCDNCKDLINSAAH